MYSRTFTASKTSTLSPYWASTFRLTTGARPSPYRPGRLKPPRREEMQQESNAERLKQLSGRVGVGCRRAMAHGARLARRQFEGGGRAAGLVEPVARDEARKEKGSNSRLPGGSVSAALPFAHRVFSRHAGGFCSAVAPLPPSGAAVAAKKLMVGSSRHVLKSGVPQQDACARMSVNGRPGGTSFGSKRVTRSRSVPPSMATSALKTCTVRQPPRASTVASDGNTAGRARAHHAT